MSILIGAALSMLALTQTAPDPIASGALEEIQVTASRRAGSTIETASGVSVVDSDAVRAVSPMVVSDALKGVVGAFVQQTTPGQGIPIVRGLKGSEVLHLVDGVRLNNALFRNAPNQYLALVDPAVIDRIEVVRGPVSSLYGSDAMGGVVQILTRRPEPNGEAFRPGFSALYRTADKAAGAQAWTHLGGEKLSALVTASHLDVGDRRTGSGERIKPSGYESTAASLATTFRPDQQSQLQFDLQYLRQPKTPRVDELVAGFGQTEAASEQFFFEPNSRLFGRLNYSRESNWAWADDVQFELSFQRIDDDRTTQDTGSPTFLEERNASKLWGLTGQFFKTIGSRFDLVYGFEIYNDTVSSSRSETLVESGQRSPVNSRFPDGSELDSVATYTHLTGQITPRLKLVAGARYSAFDVTLPSADRGVGADLDIEDVTGDAGLSFALSEDTYLVANIGRGFRAPNIFDLGTLGPRPGNRFNISNPDLGPEKVITADLGIKFRRNAWRGELFGFVSDYQDRITSVLTGETTPGGRDVVTSENVSSVDLRGIEAALTWDMSSAASLNMTLNYVHGEEDDGVGNETPADRIPPLNGRLVAQVQWGNNWIVEPYVMFASGQDRLSGRDIRDSRIDPAGTPGWATMNLRGIWQPTERWRLTMTLENIADRRYREHGSGIDATGINFIMGLHATL